MTTHRYRQNRIRALRSYFALFLVVALFPFPGTHAQEAEVTPEVIEIPAPTPEPLAIETALPEATPTESEVEDKLIEQRLRQGDAAYADGLYDVATTLYRETLDQATQEIDIVNASARLVQTQIRQGEIDEAFETIDHVIQKGIELDPGLESSSGREFRGKKELHVKYWLARLHGITGEFDSALAIYHELLQAKLPNPLRIRVYLGMGECYIAARDWDKAEAVFTEVIKSFTDEEALNQAHLGLIQMAILKGDFNHAENLIDYGWKHAAGRYRVNLSILRITVLLEKNEPKKAFVVFAENLAGAVDAFHAKEAFAVVRRLGLSLATAGETEKAIQLFTAVLPKSQSEENSRQTLLDLAEATDAHGDAQLAINHYTRYLELYPQDESRAKIQLRVGLLYEKLGQPDAALPFFMDVYDRQANRPPQRYEAAQRIAWLHKNTKNYEKAIKYFYESSTLDVSPDEKAQGGYFAAENYYLIEDYNSAAINYQTVADSYPQSRYAADARYRQAQARFQGKRYRMAAEAFQRYLTDWPDGELAEDALLQKGIAERYAEDYTMSIATLKSFVALRPESPNAPRALLEASESAAAADLQPDAIEFLSQVLALHRDSEQYPYALYRRAYLHFAYGHDEQARTDSYAFVRQFAEDHPDMAADVRLWLGDHYANHKDYGQAEQLFMDIVRAYPTSPDAPIALYEAARSAFSLSQANDQEYQKPLAYLAQLFDSYPDAPDSLIAEAQYLRGDIASVRGNFAEAIEWFQACAESVPRTELYYAAYGRLGECYYSLATVKEDPTADYQTALTYFHTIIDASNVKNSLVGMARYRAGKIYELLQQTDNAVEQYVHIFFEADQGFRNRKIADWYYFARSGFDLAKIYLVRNEYTSARSVYKRLADAGLPISEEAQLRAAEIDKQYLGQGK